MRAAAGSGATQPRKVDIEFSPEHYIQVLLHRKWRVITCFVIVTVAVAFVVQRLPNIYASETVILVDPQKVPESYVKSTVTGDVRNRLGTLTQQILSASRLQKIIEAYNLYPEQRKTLPREDVIARMRADISVTMVNGGGAQQALEAFRISYSGRDPRLVSQVTNQLATLFIDENLKAREQQATGTTDFLQQQLGDTRKALETQEAQLRDFRLKHVGEMPEHQVADLTVLGQLQASLQQTGEALTRAEQQRTYYQSMMAQSAVVIDVDAGNDEPDAKPPAAAAKSNTAPGKPATTPADDKAKLKALLAKYTENHPEVKKLKQQIAEREAREGVTASAVTPAKPAPEETASADVQEPAVPRPPAAKKPVVPAASTNPVLVSQLRTVETEIAKHREEQARLNKLVASYQQKLEAIPVREQQIASLVRDYEINKAHYTQLLDKQLSAETATQLEIRMKGEQFSVLDLAQPAQRPSSPNRKLFDAAGAMAGLFLGILLAIGPEFLGMSITSAEQIPQTGGTAVLEVIPLIVTDVARRRNKRNLAVAVASSVVAVVALAAVAAYYYKS